ncbi:acyltransferase [Acidovorax sp. SRB_14]|uniref:acyltransferase family protein n=1 Tax=Acidovorax sp. SRB_14 TaxID=1962699 RepID=UPI0015664F5B|nr:acyltransferase family protein [Acidovorax sp. SRB_14]NMM79643.1 acyltransferase [Acidovorax sp. SRB_14]
MKYRPEVDGLRAIAVLPVIVFHAGFQLFSGGFVGVDVFFVISGYLITSIILAEKKTGTFSLINFYERRARRILPALFTVLVVCLPFTWAWLLPEDMISFSQSLMAVSAYISNILFWRTSGYFETAAELKPLLHTWSLAIEEQYYFLFPIFFVAIWKLGKNWVFAILASLASLSLALAQWGSIFNPSAAFYLLPTRGWELLIGALLAIYSTEKNRFHPNRILSEFGSLLGILLLIYAIFKFNNETPFPSFYTLVPTIGTALIIFCATEQTTIGKILSHKLLVGVGLISYSAYLWHQPLFAFARHRSLTEPSKLLFTVLAMLTLGLAYFTWKYIEIPLRNKHNFSRRKIFLYSALGSSLFLSFGLIGNFNEGYPNRLPKSLALTEIELPRIDNGWCFYSIDNLGYLKVGADGVNCWLGKKSSNVKGILFGDSFAGQYEPFWDKTANELNASINAITTNWCFPSMNEEFTGKTSSRALKQCFYNRKYLIENISNYDFAVLGGSWGSVLEQKKMDGVLQLIDKLAPKVRIVILMASPKHFENDIMKYYKKSMWFDGKFDIPKATNQRDKNTLKANEILEGFSKNYTNVLFIDRDSIFNSDGKPSDLTNENLPFSLEGAHISIYGSKAAAANFLLSKKYSYIKKALH